MGVHDRVRTTADGPNRNHDRWPSTGRRVAFVPSGQALRLPCVHIAYPLPAGLGRWADPRVVRTLAVTQGVHVRAVVLDPCVWLISSADGPVTRDDDIHVVRRALEQP